MKYFFIVIVSLFIFITGNAQKGIRLKKVVNQKNSIPDLIPLSVVEIPTGTFIMGNRTDEKDIPGEQKRPVLISSFYISESEITNAQYKEFVNWVKDSIAARIMGGDYVKINNNDTSINWKKASNINYSDPDIQSKIGDMFSDPTKTLGNVKAIDPEKLIYLMTGFNYQEAAKKENKGKNPNDFIYRYKVQVYPDTLCWMRDFGYSNNEQMAINYYNSPKFQNYPVVGVSWEQANAFCDWLTKHKIYVEQNKNKIPVGGKCRLPTEAEWEYVANINTITNGNKKQDKQNTGADSMLFNSNDKIFPVHIHYAEKGKMGLFNMADNVSEWTLTSYYEGGENFQNRFNPDIQWGTPESQSPLVRRKVIRGGSWKDTPILTNINNRYYDDLKSTHSYIGFRVVINLPE